MRRPPAAVEAVEHEEDLADLAPERDLVTAQPVERIVRQLGQAQKAGKLNAGVDGSWHRR